MTSLPPALSPFPPPWPPGYPQATYYFSPSPPPPSSPPEPSAPQDTSSAKPPPFAPTVFTAYGQNSGAPALASAGLIVAIVCGIVLAALLCTVLVIWLVRRARLDKGRINPALVPQISPPRHRNPRASHKGSIQDATQDTHVVPYLQSRTLIGTYSPGEDPGAVSTPQTAGLWQPVAGLAPDHGPQQHGFARGSAAMHTDPSTASCCRMQALPHGHGVQAAHFNYSQRQQLPQGHAAPPASARADACEPQPPRLLRDSLFDATPAAASNEPRLVSPATGSSAKFDLLMSTGPLSSPVRQYDWNARTGEEASGHRGSRWAR
jgi:hypothetical protein